MSRSLKKPHAVCDSSGESSQKNVEALENESSPSAFSLFAQKIIPLANTETRASTWRRPHEFGIKTHTHAHTERERERARGPLAKGRLNYNSTVKVTFDLRSVDTVPASLKIIHHSLDIQSLYKFCQRPLSLSPPGRASEWSESCSQVVSSACVYSDAAPASKWSGGE
jgi:hypothetical protein